MLQMTRLDGNGWISYQAENDESAEGQTEPN